LNEFGDTLAPMMVRQPDAVPKGPADFSVPRASVRSRGDSGFIFFNNYARGYTMPARPAVQFQIRLPGCMLLVPRNPVDLPPGASFIWPFNFNASGVNFRYSTAQLFTRIENTEGTTLFFSAIPGIDPEFAFDQKTVHSLESSSGTKSSNAGVVYLSGIRAGKDSTIDLISAAGAKLRIVVLTAAEAENAWKVRMAGQDRLVITGDDFFADPEHIWLRSSGVPEFSFSVTPPLPSPPDASLKLKTAEIGGSWESFKAYAAPEQPRLESHLEQAPGDAPPVKLGPKMPWRKRGVAEAPSEAALPGAGRWSVEIPGDVMDGLAEVYLEVNYQGDVARLSSGGKLLDDDFYNGTSWTIGMKRFLDPGKANQFELSILPLRKDAPVYLELQSPTRFAQNDQICTIDSLRLIPDYELVIATGDK